MEAGNSNKGNSMIQDFMAKYPIIFQIVFFAMFWLLTPAFSGMRKTHSEFENQVLNNITLINREIRVINDELQSRTVDRFTRSEFDLEKRSIEQSLQIQLRDLKNEILEAQNQQFQKIIERLDK